jgi:hypothetical protein
MVGALSIPQLLNKLLVISNSNAVASGQMLRNNENTLTVIEKQAVDKLKQIDNAITALDMESYFKSGDALKEKIKDFVASEFNNNKVIVFFAEKENVNIQDVYDMLGLERDINITAVQEMPNSEEDVKSKNFVGFSVETIDGCTVVNSFYDKSEVIKTEEDKLEWIISTSSEDVVLNTSKESDDAIRAQRRIVGTGYSDYIIEPIYSTEGEHWQSRLIMYLRRTQIYNRTSSSPTTEWTGTSHITVSVRPGHSTNLSFKSLEVSIFDWDDNNNLLSFSPDTVYESITESYEVGVSVDLNGIVNNSINYQSSVSYTSVKVVASPYFIPNAGCKWKYTISGGTSIATYGGATLVQQIVFRRTNTGYAGIDVNYKATFFHDGTCSDKSAETVGPSYGSYFLATPDMT